MYNPWAHLQRRVSRAAATPEHAQFIWRHWKRRAAIVAAQLIILVAGFLLWEVAARQGWVDPFLISQPSRIWATILSLHADGSLYHHLLVTCGETVIGFLLGTVLGTLVAIVLWWSEFLARVLDPYLVVLNALPKIVLGPLFIVWLGTSQVAIVAIALAISLVTTIMVVFTGFQEVNRNQIKLVQTFGASRWQVLRKVVFPASIPTIISVLKVNVGLSFVGVIVGEFLVSKAGLGFLAIYGGQVLNMNLVMTSVILLSLAAALMYQFVAWIEKRYLQAHQDDCEAG
ncbi:MAG: ABC transporter permease [Bacillota bacterium]|jgi:NitT/TauT family transport system permease protein